MAKVAIVTGAGRGRPGRRAGAAQGDGYRGGAGGPAQGAARGRSQRQARGRSPGGAHRCDQAGVVPRAVRHAKERSAGSTCCSTTPAWARRRCRSMSCRSSSGRTVVDINLTGAFLCTPGGLQAHEGPGPARRAHHQQRLDLGAHAAAALGPLHRHQACGHRAHQVDRARRPQVRHRLRRRSTSATPRHR